MATTSEPEAAQLTEEELQELYTWVDGIPLSRPKRNISRDFSDAVLVAEVLHHYFPKEVQLHNYTPANSYASKLYNWDTLNKRVCSRLGFTIPRPLYDGASKAQPLAIERILSCVKAKIVELGEQGGLQALKEQQRGRSPGVTPRSDSNGTDSARDLTSSAGHRSAHRVGPRRAGSAGHDRRPRVGGAFASARAAGELRPTAALQQQNQELQQMVEILETKTRKLEQLVRIKESKVQMLTQRLEEAGVS